MGRSGIYQNISENGRIGLSMKGLSLSENDKFVMKMVFTLAFPAIVESLLVSMVQYVDTAMVGSLGPDATASVAASTPVMWMLNSTIQAVAVGGTVTVAQALGAQDLEKAKELMAEAGYLLSGLVYFFARNPLESKRGKVSQCE